MQIGVVVVVLVLRIVKRKRRDRRPQHVHGLGLLRGVAQQFDDGRVQLALFRQALAKFLQLVGLGQLAIPQQVASFFEI